MSEKWTCLVRIKSGDGLRSHLIEKPSFTLGRTQDSDVPLIAASISRVHLVIEVKNGEVWATDKNSANGTFRNNMPMPAGVPLMLAAGDVLRLGTEMDEFQFLAFPIPVELRSAETRAESLKDSMKELAKQFEQQSKEKVEKELRRARSESEQILAEAKKRAEIQKTQDSLELQERRAAMESEIAKLRDDAAEELARERLKAKREADNMIAEAQRSIQKDFEESSHKIEAQRAEAHTRSLHLIQQAELKAQNSLNEAREEAMKLRNDASEEARQIHKDAVAKADEYIQEVQAKYAKEMAEQKVQMLEGARVEARREAEEIIANLKQSKEDLETNTNRLEKLQTQILDAKKTLDVIEAARKAKTEEVERLKAENETLIQELKKATEIEERRDKAFRELEAFTKKREEREAAIDREMKELREKRLLEVDAQHREQDAELAKAKMKALEDLKKVIEKEEEKYEKTKRLRAMDLAQNLNAKLIPQLNAWFEDRENAPGQMKAAIEQVTIDCLANKGTVLQGVSVLEGQPQQTVEEREKKSLRAMIAVAVGFIVIGYVFRSEIQGFVQRASANSYGTKVLEDRRIQSIYNPSQNAEYRPTYTENVLYMKNYYDVKSDDKTRDAWTLKLNNLEVLRPMKLSEEDIVMFIAKEMNLVQRLNILRGSIDAVYLNEGLERMRKAEEEDVADLKKILKGDANYQKIRELEKAFLADYMAKNKP